MKIIVIGLSLLVASCCTTRNQLTGCDHYSGWCNEIRDVSKKSWKYAQLSKNVYNKKFQYKIETHFKKLKDYENDKLDFYAVLYKDIESSDLVLVYRGTDSLKDFKTGNNPFNQKQNKYALKVFDEIQNKQNNKIKVVAGHSLGGGMSIHVSLNRDDVTAFSFNGSPVFRNKKNKTNDRYSIVEYGEILKFPRIFGREATQLYTSIGCTDKGNPVDQHSMKTLASCLTQIAATESPEARKSLMDNNIDLKYKEKLANN